jgi:GTPase SAR1 family protein
MTSHTETASTDDLSFWTCRELEFRVLILGRANAGKTTILERVAGAAISEAEVRRGEELLSAQVRRLSI